MCVLLERRLNTPNEILRSLMSCAFIAANHVRRTHTLTFTTPSFLLVSTPSCSYTCSACDWIVWFAARATGSPVLPLACPASPHLPFIVLVLLSTLLTRFLQPPTGTHRPRPRSRSRFRPRPHPCRVICFDINEQAGVPK